jgi:hypothetical protein
VHSGAWQSERVHVAVAMSALVRLARLTVIGLQVVRRSSWCRCVYKAAGRYLSRCAVSDLQSYYTESPVDSLA